MLDNDLLLTFAFMAVLFLRQVSILKQPNKINYAPIMLGIGAISSVVHFIIHPDISNVVLLLRESLFPLLVALLLYIVMNILHQTQQSENSRTQDEFTKVLVNEISLLKTFIAELEERMSDSHKEDLLVQEDIRTKIQDDIKVLGSIQSNQTDFFERFDDMESWHKEVSKGFTHFREVQMPELDDVVHKHIDILRVAEQDHYNKLTNFLQTAVKSRGDISEDIDDLKATLSEMKRLSNDISRSIIEQTTSKLSGVTKAFEGQLTSLKSHTEGIKTSLSETDNTLDGIRKQSELIMKQMLLSSKNMDELEKKNSGLHDVYTMLQDIVKDVEHIRSDYVKSQAQLTSISHELAISKEEQIIAMKGRIDDLSDSLSSKIDESLAKLHEHYRITGDDITKSVQVLAKKAQLQKGYTELDTK
ncbi:hypothetical protein GJV85_07580 [Sulfurimonas aquatica]|uniref:Interaptin n=1 Tax=Sulfurimonas aquatica TaxID=2672570 RepID=A0A975B0G8_9BACT|nr:hypothetical protein [Sulfurimonas aquatica]QSZ41974.1 hypothetical protein GJV85_07580 [Sulfurimonas aquatica]